MLAYEEEDCAADHVEVGENQAEAATIKRARNGRVLTGDEFMSKLRSSAATSIARQQPFGPFPTASFS